MRVRLLALVLCLVILAIILTPSIPAVYKGDGPLYQYILMAKSRDGQHFERVNKVIMKAASTPGAIMMSDGSIWLYFVDGEANYIKVARSVDGERFDKPMPIFVNSLPSGAGPVDPGALQFFDGKVRLYALLGLMGGGSMVVSMMGRDGKHFVYERTKGLEDYSLCSPVVMREGQSYRMYASMGSRLFSFKSSDGLTFEADENFRLPGATCPSAVSLGHGAIRVYFQRAREIWSASSVDGLNFREEGVVLRKGKPGSLDQYGCGHPSVIRRKDGSYLMYYCTWLAIPPKSQFMNLRLMPLPIPPMEHGDYIGRTEPNPTKKSEWTDRVNPELVKNATISIPEGRFGVNAFMGYRPEDAESMPALSKYFSWEARELSSIGISWNRTLSPAAGPFARRNVENKDGSYDFTVADLLVRATQEYNIELVALISTGRDEAHPLLDFAEPLDREGFVEYLRATVGRYDGDGKNDMPGLRHPVRYWQITTEPEPGFYYDGEAYARTMELVKRTIKSIDPKAKILTGGARPFFTSPDPMSSYCLRFWESFLAAGGGNSIDIMDMHYTTPEPGVDFGIQISYFRDLLSMYGFKKPLWVMETGSYSGRLTRSDLPPVEQTNYAERTERDQAAWWVKHAACAFSHNVERIFWTIFFNDQSGWFRYCAFLNRDRSPKLIFYTQRLMAMKLDGFTSCRELNEGLVLFIVRGKEVYVAWGQGVLPLSGLVRITDIYGQSQILEASRVVLTEDPVFVEHVQEK